MINIIHFLRNRNAPVGDAPPVKRSNLFAAFRPAELWSGMAAAAVVLPQAMAFGVALLIPLGFEPSVGAVVGLIGAAALSFVSGIAGGTRGLISAPTGPVLVLLGGALISLMEAGLEGAELLTGLTAILIVTGIIQMFIGLSGGGRLIKFMPFTVVAGFMSGSAILMIMSQVKALSGEEFSANLELWRLIPVATAAITVAIVAYTPRVLPAVPGTIAGLVGGSIVFQGLILLVPTAVPEAWTIGALPGAESIKIVFTPSALKDLPWIIIFISGLALAVLASLDTLLTSVIADIGTGVRHNAKRELIGQGLGQIVAGMFGGMAGAGTTGATLVAVKTGGRRWAGVTAGISFILLLLIGGPIGYVLPISVLAGIILHVAMHMLEKDIIAWIRRRKTRMDAGIAIFVTIITVAYDLMVAVGVGVLIAVILFIRDQIKAPVIHRRSTSIDVHSVRHRPKEQRALLDEHGDRIVLYELRGNLFFATADRLLEELAADLDRPAWIILHMRRVNQVDLTGVKILQQIADRLHSHGGQLIFCNVHRQIGLGKKVKQTLKKISPNSAGPKVKTFNGSDEALEYAEDALLTELGSPPLSSDISIALADMDMCADMTAGQVAALGQVLRTEKIEGGEKPFAIGDKGEELYLITEGDIDIRLPTTKHHYKRLAKYGPGSLFGEIAFLQPGPRAADAIAMCPSELLVLDRPAFDSLVEADNSAAIALLIALGKAQGNNLRWSAMEISRLAQW